MRRVNLLALILFGLLGLAFESRCHAQFIAYSGSPMVAYSGSPWVAYSGSPMYVQSGGWTAYSGAPGYYPGYYYGRHHHRHHWRHYSQGFVGDFLVPGITQLVNQQLTGTNPPADGGGNVGNVEPPVEWKKNQGEFLSEEAVACKNAQSTLAVLVDLRKQFPGFQFKSADKCDCVVAPIDVVGPGNGGGAPVDVDVPGGVRP
jgi:hypothetical protein